MAKLFVNSKQPDQMSHSAASKLSDLGLHHLPITPLGISRLKWVKFGMGLFIDFAITDLL